MTEKTWKCNTSIRPTGAEIKQKGRAAILAALLVKNEPDTGYDNKIHQMIRGGDIERITPADNRTVRVHYVNGNTELLTYKNNSVVNVRTGEEVITKAQYLYLIEKERVERLK